MGDLESSLPLMETVKCRYCGCDLSLTPSNSESWIRSVKRKVDELEDGDKFIIPGFGLPIARVEIENECVVLREAVSSQQKSIEGLYAELEEERNASASATNEAMSMILRLQREKAEIQMEARQFKYFAEEKIAHDQEELMAFEDLLYKREQAIQALTCDVQAYKHRLMSYGLTEYEAESERINQCMLEEGQFDSPVYQYPPLKCNLNETRGTLEIDKNVADIEKYSSHETPHGNECLKNLELTISQMEKSPRTNQVDGDIPSARNILEKVIVGLSPRQTMHSRKLSADTSSSFSAFTKEAGQEFSTESPRLSSSYKQTHYVSQAEDHVNMKKFDTGSDGGDDISDRVYTIDAVHNGVPNSGVTESRAGMGVYDDDMSAPRESLNHADFEDPEIKKLYMRLQALEADRESMRQTIISMRIDKAQLVLLREIAQELVKDMSPERRMPMRKASNLGGFSFMAVLKWIVSLILWRKRARRSKYMFGLSANNMGLLMLLDKGPHVKPWRCLTRTQV